ncbi:MAG: AI-2E family transporter [Planctomycetia bacterium]
MPSPSDRLQSAWWLAVGAALLWIVWLLGPILTPFLAGAVLAYILDPVVEWLVRRRVPRAAAAALVLLLGFVVLLALFLIVAPLIRKEAAELAGRVPALLDRLDASVAPWLEATLGREVHVDFVSLKAFLTEQLQGSEGLWGGCWPRRGPAAWRSSAGSATSCSSPSCSSTCSWTGTTSWPASIDSCPAGCTPRCG